MATTTNFSVRMDSDIKKQCEALYGELGINLTTAINVFLRQSLRAGGFPFDVRMEQPNKETIAAMLEAERIACEDKSTDTHENTAFSMEVIRKQGWSTDVAIATQVFHQYRAAVNARAAGAPGVGGVACFSPLHLMLNYWVRECAAICRLWLFGY